MIVRAGHWFAVATLAVSGCGVALVDPCAGVAGTCVALQVDGPASTQPIDQLAIALRIAGRSLPVQETQPPALQSLPIAVALRIDDALLPDSSDPVTVDVLGLRQGITIGEGGAGTVVTRGAHAVVSVQLAPFAADLAAPGDLGADLAPTDLAGADLATSDLATADLAHADLAATDGGVVPVLIQPGGYQNTNGTSLTLTLTGTLAGSTIIAFVAADASAFTTPAGWSLISAQGLTPDNSCAVALFRLTSPGGDIAASFGTTGSNQLGGWLSEWRNVGATINGNATHSIGAATSQAISGGASGNDLAFTGFCQGSSSVTIASGAGWTTLHNAALVNANLTMISDYRIGGFTGVASESMTSNVSATWAAAIVTLQAN